MQKIILVVSFNFTTLVRALEAKQKQAPLNLCGHVGTHRAATSSSPLVHTRTPRLPRTPPGKALVARRRRFFLGQDLDRDNGVHPFFFNDGATDWHVSLSCSGGWCRWPAARWRCRPACVDPRWVWTDQTLNSDVPCNNLLSPTSAHIDDMGSSP
jgi:hypothetical protein